MAGWHPALALLYSFGWGVVAMFVVSVALYWLLHLEETGNIRIADALGEEGTVYIEVPPEGLGQVRVTVDGIVSHIRARCRSGESLIRGTKVRVVGIIDEKTIEVEPEERHPDGK